MVTIINNDINKVDVDNQTVTVIPEPCSITAEPGDIVQFVRGADIVNAAPNHQISWGIGWADATGATGGIADQPYEFVSYPAEEPTIIIRILNTSAKYIDVWSDYGNPNIRTEYKINII